MAIFIENLQNECLQISLAVRQHINHQTQIPKDFEHDLDGIVEGIIERKALTCVIVMLVLYAHSYIPNQLNQKQLHAKMCNEIREQFMKALIIVGSVQIEIYQKVYNLGHRVLRVSDQIENDKTIH